MFLGAPDSPRSSVQLETAQAVFSIAGCWGGLRAKNSAERHIQHVLHFAGACAPKILPKVTCTMCYILIITFWRLFGPNVFQTEAIT